MKIVRITNLSPEHVAAIITASAQIPPDAGLYGVMIEGTQASFKINHTGDASYALERIISGMRLTAGPEVKILRNVWLRVWRAENTFRY